MASQEELGQSTASNTPESCIQAELGRHVYTRAEELRMRALAKVGLSAEGIAPGVRHHITLRSPSYRLQVELGADSQLRADDDTLRQIIIKDNPYQGEEFHRGRYVEPDGTMWQMADSSQGQPWYHSNLPSADLAEMLNRLEELESSNYHVEVSLSAYQQAPAVTSAA